MELTETLASSLGVTLSWRSFETQAALEQALRDGRIDFAPGQVQTPAGLRLWRYSDPYLRIPHLLVGERLGEVSVELERLGEREPIAVRVPSMVADYLRSNYFNLHLQPQPSARQALQAVVEQRARYAVVDQAQLSRLSQESDYSRLAIIADVGLPQLLRFGTRPDWPQLGAILDTGLRQLPAEQLEQLLTTVFPQYPVVRIDRDNTRRKGELETHLGDIKAGKYKILIGTQMLAKGHHFPDVTLVGLLDVDGALFSADFRAAEKLAQLYTQVAGRAGRASKPGLVVLQSHHPEHALLQDLTQNGYGHFADTALKERRLLGLPPFSHQGLFRAEANGRDEVQLFLSRLADTLRSARYPQVQVLGPISGFMERKAGKFRMQLLVQGPSRAPLAQLLDWAVTELEGWPETKRVRWSLDIDPTELN